MKLLLTSSGLTNKSITNALFDMVGKKPEETKVVFIPTAANVEVGDKNWFINDLVNLQKQNFAEIDIADISAVDRKIWEPKLKNADVLFFEGGNTYHLMGWLNKSGLTDVLPELLQDKVYVGVSAGSMVTNKDLALTISQIVYGEDLDRTKDMEGLNYVDFYFLPHLNSKWFPNLKRDVIEKTTKDMSETIYAMDDRSALKVIEGDVEVISEGDWFVLNEK